jgi:hypothetical protein
MTPGPITIYGEPVSGNEWPNVRQWVLRIETELGLHP